MKRGMAKMASFMMALPALEASLRMYRTEQAFVRSVPAGSIFGNQLMRDIASARPSTLKQLLALPGMGSRRCKAYGQDILKLVGGKKSGTKRPTNSARPKPRPKPRPRPRPRPECKPVSPACQLAPAELVRSIAAKSQPSPVPQPCKLAPTELVKSTPSKGRLKPAQQAPPLCKQCPLKAELEVYILELEEGRVYVGSSRNLDRRIDQHKGGFGSAFTKVYRPTGVRLPRLGNISGDGDAAERDETLRYMYQRGIPFVRGWKFTQVAMPPEEFEEAEANIRELFELCRKCGYKGHFITQCKATFDRWGKEC